MSHTGSQELVFYGVSCIRLEYVEPVINLMSKPPSLHCRLRLKLIDVKLPESQFRLQLLLVKHRVNNMAFSNVF